MAPPHPLITIVVATFNASKTLVRCIESIENQTYPHVELIIWDGKSTDGTVELLKAHSKSIAYWNSEKDLGIYDAWNKVLGHAQGDWILFLGADDFLWNPMVLENLAPHLIAAYPKYRVVYGCVQVTMEDGTLLEHNGKSWPEIQKLFQHEMCIPHQGTFQHKDLFTSHGLFDPSFRITGDYDFLLRELKTRDALFLPEITVSGMQFGGISSSISSTLTNIRELRRSRKNNGLKPFSLPLLWRETRALSRIAIQRFLGKKFADHVADAYRIATGKPRLWTLPRTGEK